ALMHAAMRKGLQVNRWETSAPIAANAGKLDQEQLLTAARSPDVERRVRESTAEFHQMQATQRPTFLLQNTIGDKATFSGIWAAPPLVAAIDAMLEDQRSYVSWAAHVGEPPSS